MKIRYEYKKKESLAEFAESNNLTMVVRERSNSSLPRFFAAFEHADVKEGPMLVGQFGNGNTEEEAMSAYAKSISNTLLVVQNPGSARKEILCPELEYINDKG